MNDVVDIVTSIAFESTAKGIRKHIALQKLDNTNQRLQQQAKGESKKLNQNINKDNLSPPIAFVSLRK